jgi:peroxiredoxin
MSQGQAPDCHCFGQLHSAPAGKSTLARNAAFALLALIVALRGPGPAIDAWVGERSGAQLVAVASAGAAIILAALALRLWIDRRGLRRELAEARTELDALPPGLPVGATAPAIALAGIDGTTVTLEALLARGQSIILLFVSPQCGPCWMMLPSFAQWQATLAGRLTLALVSTGTADENRRLVDTHGIGDVLLQEKTEVMKAYRVRATPTAVAISPDGRIASTTVEGGRPIEPLIRLTLQGGSTRRRSVRAAAAADRPS